MLLGKKVQISTFPKKSQLFKNGYRCQDETFSAQIKLYSTHKNLQNFLSYRTQNSVGACRWDKGSKFRLFYKNRNFSRMVIDVKMKLFRPKLNCIRLTKICRIFLTIKHKNWLQHVVRAKVQSLNFF